MSTLTTVDPTQPPVNPAAPVLRDDLLNWQPPSPDTTAHDFVEGLGEPPD
jgi:hypothetical protein